MTKNAIVLCGFSYNFVVVDQHRAVKLNNDNFHSFY